MCRPLRAALLAALLLLAAAHPAAAHKLQVEPVVSVLRPQESGVISAEFVGNVQDVTQSVGAEDKDLAGEGWTPAVTARVERYWNERFLLRRGDALYTGRLVSLTHSGGLDPNATKFRLFVRYEAPAGADPAAPVVIENRLLDYLPNARVIVSLGGLNKTLTYGETASVDPSAIAVNLLTNVREFAKMGVEHIFTGPDHMLFILALLLVASSFRGLVKTLTGFTVAHSITLILSALSVVVLPERLTDILVAVSILYVGAENIFLANRRRPADTDAAGATTRRASLFADRRFWVASGFGLIHGFGFSGVLRDIGLPTGAAQFWTLLSFNLGVEIAQVILCAAAFPLLMIWKRGVERRARHGGMPWSGVTNFASAGVIVAGAYWLVQRAFGG